MERGKLVMFGGIAELGKKMTTRKISLKWRGDGDKAIEILKSGGVKDLEAQSNSATFRFEGGTDGLDELLKSLVNGGTRVSEWRAAGDDLEQIFLESGARELM